MNDLISRQALCDDLREYKVHPVPVSSDESEVKGYNDGIDLAISVIAEFPSAEPELRWIPVSERLPEKYQRVFVTIKRTDGEMRVRSGNYFYDYFWIDNGDYLKCNEVLAWMPLPEPWRGE